MNFSDNYLHILCADFGFSLYILENFECFVKKLSQKKIIKYEILLVLIISFDEIRNSTKKCENS